LEKENNSPLFFEARSPLISFTLGLAFGLLLVFYKVSLILAIPVLIFFFSCYKRISLKAFAILTLGFLTGFMLGWKSFSAEVKLPKKSFKLFFRVLKVEPYYHNSYRVVAESESLGRFEFFTKQRVFKPESLCLGYFKGLNVKRHFDVFSPELATILKSKGIKTRLFSLPKPSPVCKTSKGFSFEKLRYRLFVFSEALPPVSRGLFQALVLGVQRNMPRIYLEKLRNFGLYHQLAISGFNLAVLFGFFYFLAYFVISRVWENPLLPYQTIACILALPAAFFVLALSGFTPSATRAFVFLSLLVLAKTLFRNTTTLSVLFTTALMLLLFDPFLVGNISFQLSFLATFAILIGDRIFKRFTTNSSSFALRVLNAVFISFIVSVIICPLLILLSGKFPLGTPLNNLIAGIFWGSIFIPGALIIAVIALISYAPAYFLAKILGKLFIFYASLPFIEWTFIPSIPAGLFFVIYVLVLATFILINTYSSYGKALLVSLSLGLGSYLLFSFLNSKICQVIIYTGHRYSQVYITSQRRSWCLGRYCEKSFKMVSTLRKLGISLVKKLNKNDSLNCGELISAPGIFYWEFRGFTLGYVKSPIFSYTLPVEVLVSEKGWNRVKSIKEVKLKILPGRKRTYFIFPKSEYFLICDMEELKKGGMSLFFPFVPYIIEEGLCKRIEYQGVKHHGLRNL